MKKILVNVTGILLSYGTGVTEVSPSCSDKNEKLLSSFRSRKTASRYRKLASIKQEENTARVKGVREE